MTSQLLFFAWAALAPAAGFAAPAREVVTPEFKIFPEAIFAQESTAIIVTANLHLKAGQPEPKLSVIETDAQGNRVRYIGILTDDGVMGDRVAHDGIFTRKFEVSEKRREQLYFAIVADDEAMKPHPAALESATASAPAPLELHVIRRPTFIELVGQALHKIRMGLSKPVQS